MKVLIFVCICALSLGLVTAPGGGRGGGGRGSSRGIGSRGGGSGGGGSGGGESSPKRTYIYGPYDTSTVTRNTPIPLRNPRSPVIRAQSTIPTRPDLGTRLFVGYLLVRYKLKEGPVYRESYTLQRGVVSIPDDRAIRVNFTEEKILDSNGYVCLRANDRRQPIPDYQQQNATVSTLVRYRTGNIYQDHVYLGDNRTIQLDKAQLNKSVEIWVFTKYNGSIIANTDCIQIKTKMNGTMVQMYATNPDSAGVARNSLWVTCLSAVLYFAFNT